LSNIAGGLTRRGRIGPVITAVVLTVLLLWMVGTTADVFLLLFLAIIISLYLGAVRDLFVKRLRVGPRVGFLLAILTTLLALAGVVWLIVPPVVSQTRELLSVLPTYVGVWEARIDQFMVNLPGMRGYWHPGQHQLMRVVYDQLSGAVQGFVPRVFSIVGVFIDVFSVIVMSIYLASQPGVYREWLIALFPPKHRDLVRDILHDVADALRGYIVGQLTTMSVLAALTAFFLWLLHVPYWLTFGVFTGIVSIIPFFGTPLSTLLPAAFVVTGPNGGTHATLVLGVGVLVHLIEGNLVSPLVMSKRVELPPVLTMMAVLVTGRLLGALGLVIAVPALAAIMVIVRRILINRIYEGKSFRRAVREAPLIVRVPAPRGGVLLPQGEADIMAVRATLAK
jgi:predicted PurR-regulated permease PerM